MVRAWGQAGRFKNVSVWASSSAQFDAGVLCTSGITGEIYYGMRYVIYPHHDVSCSAAVNTPVQYITVQQFFNHTLGFALHEIMVFRRGTHAACVLVCQDACGLRPTWHGVAASPPPPHPCKHILFARASVDGME